MLSPITVQYLYYFIIYIYIYIYRHAYKVDYYFFLKNIKKVDVTFIKSIVFNLLSFFQYCLLLKVLIKNS